MGMGKSPLLTWTFFGTATPTASLGDGMAYPYKDTHPWHQELNGALQDDLMHLSLNVLP